MGSSHSESEPTSAVISTTADIVPRSKCKALQPSRVNQRSPNSREQRIGRFTWFHVASDIWSISCQTSPRAVVAYIEAIYMHTEQSLTVKFICMYLWKAKRRRF